MSENSNDHDVIDVLRASGVADERRDLADSLIAELARHSVAEQMYVYPTMRDHLPNGGEASSTTPASTRSWRP